MTSPIPSLKTFYTLLTVLCLTVLAQPAWAASGTWTNDASGNWGDAVNWANGTVADGAGSTADFSTVDITGDRTVMLDAAHTISTLIFGDAGATPDHNWILGGANTLTLGTTPVIFVSNQTATLNIPIAGTAGMVKLGNGTLIVKGTNSYTGTISISNGVVNYSGGGASTGGGVYNVGAPAGRAVVNINTAGSVINNGGSYGVGGSQGDTTDTGVGVINILAGTLLNGNNNNYTEIGTGSLNGNALGAGSYGCINLLSGAFTTTGSSGIRVGAGGVGIFNQTGGTLNDSRYFAVGSQPNGGTAINAGGTGLANFLGGTATIASGYRVILNDKPGAVGIINIGSEAGGTATFIETSTASGGAFEFMDQGGASAQAVLNLNSGTLRLAAPMYRANTGGTATFNWNGGKFQAAGNMNFALAANNFPAISLYNGGAIFDGQTFSVTNPVSLVQPAGNGIYPAGGTFAIANNGGNGYLGLPYVNITTSGAGAGAMAIANLTGGVVTGVTLTCPGQNYQAGDTLTFTFTGGGAITPAAAYVYTLQAADLAVNSGSFTKLGSGTLRFTATNSYTGGTAIGAGTLDVQIDGGLGGGNVTVANGATLILEKGAANAYISSAANLIVSSSGLVNLNFSGADTVNGLSLDGGATYVAPGTYGSSSSGAANVDDTHFTGGGTLTVQTTPVVALNVVLNSSVNPSISGQPVTLTATVTSTGGGTPAGTVTFKDSGTSIGTGTLNGSGMAALNTSTLAVGSHPLTAVYQTATSPILNQVVNTPNDVWNGTPDGLWDISTSANWLLLGSPATYQDGNYVQFDDTAAGITAVTLNSTVSPLNVTITNNTKNYSISGTGGIAGAGGLNMFGTGGLTLNVSNSYTGSTWISNGVVTYGPASANSGNGSILVGANNGLAVLNINTTNTLAFNGLLSVGGNIGDTADTGVGAINQTSGTFNSGGGGNAYIEVGTGGGTAYGAYTLSGGVLNAVNASGVRVGATGYGNYIQSGGFLNCGRYFAVGTQSGVNNIGGNGVATFTGGAATFSSAFRIIVGDKPGSTGVFNLGTEAGGTATLTNLYNNAGNGGIELLDNAAALGGTLNLNSGVLQIGGAIYINPPASGSPAINLNGATLQAGANNINLITNFSSVLIGDFGANLFSRGIVVDSQTNTCYITADLLATSGNGVYPAAGALAVTDGGAGYVGAPLVAVNGGSGYGAMAIATVSNGVIVNVIMTCPGQNYQTGDVLDFQFTSGGAITPAGDFNYTVQAGDLLSNANGGLAATGSGHLILTSFNDTYTGNTVVSNGLLEIAGSLTGGGAVNVNGGTLGGNGTISGPVTVNVGGTLTAGVTNVGTLTINNNLTFKPGAIFSAKIDKGAGAQDQIQGVSQLNYAGTLMVTNLSGSLAVGDSFKLFNATTYAGAFTGVIPATPGPGLAWDTTQLANNGSLNIVVGSAVNPEPTNIVFGVTNNVIYLSWPADHTGWVLQTQTNSIAVGLSTNWVNVPNSSTVNQMALPVDPATGSVFYRLVLPNP